MKECTVRCKVWLEVDGQPLIGTGRERLLLAIDATGSINAAARELGIAYRKVWAQLQEMEKIAPFPLLTRRTGGNGGGATALTAEARRLLEEYRRLDDEVRRLAATCPLPKVMHSEEG